MEDPRHMLIEEALKAVTGVGFTTTVDVEVLLQPEAFAVIVTVYVPAVEYKCIGDD